ncbi:uncharacterized protein LOC118743077 [Rhagoletis pomonella]|uniref:uncharacterized protein LOC118743077 n=1 Tax=Rhagoletis pomonella TaxID=28610 RepID=UPI0017871F43|nr:uncharacterized protein LOC118743077 [Rhagoletis pomonella]
MPSSRKCRVRGCKSEGSGMRFFCFPQDPIENKKWRENLLYTSDLDFLPPYNSHVCIRHFEPTALGEKCLKRGAIPTLNLGYDYQPPHNFHIKKHWKEVCCIKNCTSDAKRKFFTYRKYNESWNKVCNIDPSKYPRPLICELHFDKEFITPKRLRLGAFPTLNLPRQLSTNAPAVQNSETIQRHENKRTCCIRSCRGDKNATLISFPVAKESRTRWIKACNLNASECDELYICARHFQTSFLTTDEKLLKIGAFPTLNLHSHPDRGVESITTLQKQKSAISPNKTQLPLEFEQHYFLECKRKRYDSFDSDMASNAISFVSEKEEIVAPNAGKSSTVSSLHCNDEKSSEDMNDINSERENAASAQDAHNKTLISTQCDHASLSCSSKYLDVPHGQTNNEKLLRCDQKHFERKIKDLETRVEFLSKKTLDCNHEHFEKRIAELEGQSKQEHKCNQEHLDKRFAKLEAQVEYESKRIHKCEAKQFVERVAELEGEIEFLKSKYRILEERAVIPFDGASQDAVTFAKMIVDGPNRRYTEKEKCLAQNLTYISPKAYDFMREELKCVLPHKSILLRWRPTTSCGISGIDDHTTRTLKNIVSEMSETDRICHIMFHEVVIKKDEEPGSTATNTLKSRQKCCFFIVKGIFSDWKYILSYFIGQTGFNAYNLLRYLNQSIDFAQCVGLKVKAIVCDQSLCNAHIYKQLYATEKKPYILRKKEKIHCFFDYFHLTKCIRNSFLSYDIQTIDGLASFKIIKKLYTIDKAYPSLGLFPKLTPSHLYPDTVERMDVYLAVQLLSNSVAVGIEKAINQKLMGSDPKLLNCARATKNFVKRMNDLFDEFDHRDQCVLSATSSYRKKINALKDHLKFLYSLEQPNMINIRFISGLISTTKATINFYEDVFEKYKSLDINLLSKFNQVALNSLFYELCEGRENTQNDIQTFVASSRREFEQKFKNPSGENLKHDAEKLCEDPELSDDQFNEIIEMVKDCSDENLNKINGSIEHPSK